MARYSRVYESLETHPKFDITNVYAGTGLALYLKALSHAAHHRTDGRVSRAWALGQLADLAPRQTQLAIHALLDRGLFEAVDEGFIVHDYPHYNQTRAQSDEARRRDRDRKRADRAAGRLFDGQVA